MNDPLTIFKNRRMNMGYNSSISGVIKGISEDSFELIKEDLEDVFDIVNWKNGELFLESYGKHYDEVMLPVYNRIAFCIDKNPGGELNEDGDEQFDFSTIFFSPRQWKKLWVEVNFPENPFKKPGYALKAV
ncbi:MAG: hypothetical protein KKE62_16020 [Proteobacteria bacterium]|nr:hypothetical protein [Pseudomonadota bacterium]MBU1544337.1 hypothetical protein [Pseudomonadota bacterium]MBU2429321.1 hypothetical protein [Pseudomonadota bacterium]